ncbi:MAG: hypothetical protein IJR64_00655 [Bacteroidales bacterium]|nr:hypothetical protein [Bacteroidales bacterium]
MKSSFYVFAILTTGLLLSCRQSNDVSILDIGEPKPIVAEKTCELMCSEITEMAILDNELYVFPSTKDIALVVDLDSGKYIKTWGRRGRGSGEMLRAEYWGPVEKGRGFWLYDSQSFKLRKYEKNNRDGSVLEIKEEYSIPVSLFPAHGAVLPFNRMAVNVASAFDYTSPLVLTDMHGTVKEKDLGRIPDEHHKEVRKVSQGKLADYRSYEGRISSFGNHFVSCLSYGGYISFWKMEDSVMASLQKEHFLEKILYNEENNTLLSPKLRWGFMDVKMTSKRVYALYSGKEKTDVPGAKSVLVFSHEGKLLYHFSLDFETARIAVSADDSILCASMSDPEAGIAIFRL